MTEKLFYSIEEVSQLIEEPKTTIRYWERHFKEVTPKRTPGGRRLYTSKDIDILRRIKYLLHIEGLSISSARKKLHKKSNIDEIINDLMELKRILEGKDA